MNQTVLEKLSAKYGVQERDIQEKESKPVLKHWRDSDSVFKFFYFMREFGVEGFYVQQTREGVPVMHFNPGLKGPEKEPERWILAEEAMWLMDQAREDLKHLISIGALTFPENKEL